MKDSWHKAIDVAIVIIAIGISIAIFLNRNEIENVGSASYIGVLILCFLSNATVLLPAPSLMVVASCGLIMNPVLVAAFAATGATTGELVGYYFGKAADGISPKFQRVLKAISNRIRNEYVLVFVFAALPLPIFDVVGIYSGGNKINILKFFVLCFFGKFIKMLIYTKAYDILEWTTTIR